MFFSLFFPLFFPLVASECYRLKLDGNVVYQTMNRESNCQVEDKDKRIEVIARDSNYFNQVASTSSWTKIHDGQLGRRRIREIVSCNSGCESVKFYCGQRYSTSEFFFGL